MLPSFSGRSGPNSGAPSVQPIQPNAFPVVEFSEPPMETPLDLNFAQSPQSTPMEAEKAQPVKSEASPSAQQQDSMAQVVGQGGGATPSGDGSRGGKSANDSFETPPSKTRGAQKASLHWTHPELNALFDAKKAQAEKAESGPRKLRSSTLGKWEEIAAACKKLGFPKTAAQCREKWGRLWPSFSSILDWENKLSEKKSSYWAMTEKERVQGGFPGLFDREVYDAMLARFRFVTSLNPASPILISLNVDSAGVSFKEPVPTVDVNNEAGQNGAGTAAEGQPVDKNHKQKGSSRKRKIPDRQAASKQTLESNKKAMVFVHLKEEAITGDGGNNMLGSPRKEPCSISSKTKEQAPLDAVEITERKLVLEEKKLRLAEQRFSLEQKKLEATIEIGKSLIASMERMTGTISSLGPTAATQHQ